MQPVDYLIPLVVGVAAIIGALAKKARTRSRANARAETLAEPAVPVRAQAPTPATLSIEKRAMRFAGKSELGEVPSIFAVSQEPHVERRLVENLFASPRSLAAAFIVSEVLQPPVALRGSRRTDV